MQYFPPPAGDIMNLWGHYTTFIKDMLFWKNTRSLLEYLVGPQTPLDPAHLLPGLPIPNTAKSAIKLINHILTAARCLKWRQLPPSQTDLYKRIHDVHNMEYLRA